MEDKVFCSECEYHFKDSYTDSCKHENNIQHTVDSAVKKGGEFVSYGYCPLLNGGNDCQYFEQKKIKEPKKTFIYYIRRLFKGKNKYNRRL